MRSAIEKDVNLPKGFVMAEDREFLIEMGERITALRRAQSMTQAQLAEKLGVTQAVVAMTIAASNPTTMPHGGGGSLHAARATACSRNAACALRTCKASHELQQM